MKAEVKVTELSHKELVHLFSTAFYGNSICTATYTQEEYNKVPLSKRHGHCFEDHIADILLNGGKVRVADYEADENDAYGKLPHVFVGEDDSPFDYDAMVYEVRLANILKGCSTIEGFKYAQELFDEDGDGDMWTAFNLMQIIVFGEEIYG